MNLKLVEGGCVGRLKVSEDGRVIGSSDFAHFCPGCRIKRELLKDRVGGSEFGGPGKAEVLVSVEERATDLRASYCGKNEHLERFDAVGRSILRKHPVQAVAGAIANRRGRRSRRPRPSG